MNNAEKFKQIFGLYVTELWSMPESDFLEWLNRDVETTQIDHTADIGKKVCVDTISRQAAIDAYGDWYVEEGTEEGFIGTVKQLLEGLPSAQPETSCSEIPNSSTDCISRRAAIDAIMGQPPEPHYPSWYAAQIEKLPAVQPEIIRCKDCKYWRDDHTCHEHSLVSPMCANEYCSRAERRTDE